jgi:hypothetical protein
MTVRSLAATGREDSARQPTIAAPATSANSRRSKYSLALRMSYPFTNFKH